MDNSKDDSRLLRVGELAKAVGKTVRAMHLYEELGLLEPAARSEGGFRLYSPDAIERINWIIKLQAIGFTLAEIQGFVRDFRGAASGNAATERVRAMFSEKLSAIREQITQLQVIENDLHEALEYLESCTSCSDEHAPSECGVCGHHGHSRGDAPHLFSGLSRRPEGSAGAGLSRREESGCGGKPFDVPVTVLHRDSRPGSAGSSEGEN